MRIFYEGWSMLERPNSSDATDEFTENNNNSAVATAEFKDDKEIRQLQLANLPVFPFSSPSPPACLRLFARFLTIRARFALASGGLRRVLGASAPRKPL